MDTFQSCGDTELWHTTVGPYQVPCYAIPVRSALAAKAWMVKTAVPLNPSTHRGLAAELSAASTWQTVTGWIIEDGTFNAMFKKAEGITPAYYYRKHGQMVDQRAIETEIITADFDPYGNPSSVDKSFIEDLCRRTEIDDLPTLKILWNAICNHMAYWLLIEQRQLDMGWFKIGALPVRANWKQILAAKHPNLGSVARVVDPDERTLEIAKKGIDRSIQETTLIALHGDANDRHVGWTLEVVPSKAWDDYVHSMEKSRLMELGVGSDYPAWWGVTWSRLRSYAYTALFRFASSAALPAATVGSRGNRSRSGFVAYVPEGAVRPARVDDTEVSVVGIDSPDALRLPNGKLATIHPPERMPKMPILRLRIPDVRNPRRRGKG
jgi:hypothetical protein